MRAAFEQVGGTSVYEERRSESLKILQETEARRTRINEVVGSFRLIFLHDAFHSQCTT